MIHVCWQSLYTWRLRIFAAISSAGCPATLTQSSDKSFSRCWITLTNQYASTLCHRAIEFGEQGAMHIIWTESREHRSEQIHAHHMHIWTKRRHAHENKDSVKETRIPFCHPRRLAIENRWCGPGLCCGPQAHSQCCQLPRACTSRLTRIRSAAPDSDLDFLYTLKYVHSYKSQ